jgi:hypothetical protein
MPSRIRVPKTPENLVVIADTIGRFSTDLRSIADEMREASFEVLGITNDDQRRRGMEYLEKYVNAARAALREAREARGDYGQKPAPKIHRGRGKKAG